LIRAVEGAHNAFLDLEELSEDELERIRARYESLAREARDALERGKEDTDVPDINTK
jgi:low affinity Fe/Cu permease